MTSLSNVEMEPEATKIGRPDRIRREKRSAPFIALALIFLPLNAGILIYTAKNAADVRENRDMLSDVKRSIDGLKVQMDKQAHNIAGVAKADDTAVIRRQVEQLGGELSALDDRMRSGSDSRASDGAVILSAPGKELTQPANRSPGAASEVQTPPTETGPSTGEAGDMSAAAPPRYERSISPDGKLILRKVR